MYITGILMFQPWLMIDSIFKLSQYNRLLRESNKETNSFIMTVTKMEVSKKIPIFNMSTFLLFFLFSYWKRNFKSIKMNPEQT